jgi:hypothetical protein
MEQRFLIGKHYENFTEDGLNMNQFLVVQTTTVEGPAGPTFVTDSLIDALNEQEIRQAKTKDIWVVAEVFDQDGWFFRFIQWLQRKFKGQ